MRKHDVRKWLHAILDLLPVILIPVFMVYSHRHDVTQNVEINYKYQSNEVNTLDDLVVGNIYHCNRFMPLNGNLQNGENYSFKVLNIETEPVYDFNTTLDEMYISYFDNLEGSLYFYVNFTNASYTLQIYYDFDDTYATILCEPNGDNFDLTLFDFDFIVIDNIEIFKNEIDFLRSDFPEFNFTISQSDYNVIESVDITNTNVMDSFMNNFNNTIDAHFNMGNVFNLGDVYQWFNTNIFGGNAPVVIYSIYNIVLYELVMDLLFLLYALFMWFIDMIQKLMDKPLNSIK